MKDTKKGRLIEILKANVGKVVPKEQIITATGIDRKKPLFFMSRLRKMGMKITCQPNIGYMYEGEVKVEPTPAPK